VTGRALLLGALLLALVPASASAHAVLQDTVPQRGAQLDSAPGEVVLRFNEPVEAAFGAVRVFDARGEQVQEGDVFRPGGDSKKVAIRVPDDMRGGYTVTYRVISADSHPVSSGFVFTVGEGAAPAATVDELLAGSKAGSVTWNALSVARGVQYAAIAVGLGSVVFLLFAWLPALTESAGAGETWRAASQAFAARLRTLLGLAALAGALSAAAAVVLQGAVASASSFWSALSPDTVSEILGTRFGTVWGFAAVAWVIVGGLVVTRVAAVPQLRPASVGATGLAPSVPRWGALAVLPLAFLAAVPALGGHASVQDPRWVLLPANVLHVIAISAWLGGIAVLVLALRSATAVLEGADRTRLLAAVVSRFSALAGIAIAVVLATGIAQSIVHLESWGDLLDTAFGRAILVKSGLFLLIVVLGWVNRNRLLPALRRSAAEGTPPAKAGVALRRTLRVELALGAAVIAATGALASYAPPTSLGAGPFSTDFEIGPARAEVTIDPAEVGTNDVHMYFFRSDTGAQYDATKELRITAELPDKGIAPIELDPRKAGPGHYVVLGAAFGVAGEWQVTVSSRVSEFDAYEGSFQVEIE
jgi:copper transport protein